METRNRAFKWGHQLCSGAPALGVRARRAACQKLAADETAQAVPFLVSALGDQDEEVRSLAEQRLRSLTAAEAVEALAAGCAFTGGETLRAILAELGRPLPGPAGRPEPGPCGLAVEPPPGEEAWRIRNERDGTVLAFVPAGDFLAGEERFRASLPAYYMALGCVTNAQYAHFLAGQRPKPTRLASWIHLEPACPIHKEERSYVVDEGAADLPVVWVTWEGATAYCKWAGLRLPAELEWEKGARGVDGRQYPWGEEWEAGRPLPTDDKREPETISSVWAHPGARSPYGLYQMIGNVYEWCADWYEEGAYRRYAGGDMKPPARGEQRVLRGGPWRFGTPAHLRTEYRKSTVWRAGTMLSGFRCAGNP